MSSLKQENIRLINELPDECQQEANNALKEIFRAWDSDFTKTTPAEAKRIEKALREIENGDTEKF